MIFWSNKFDKIEDIPNITSLPFYSHQFVLKNLGPFKTSFIVLSAVTATSTILRFLSVYIISELLSQADSINKEMLLLDFLPKYLILVVGAEGLDFFTRKYSEAMPNNYLDHIRLRFYKTILRSKFNKLIGYSKERLNNVISSYLDGVSKFMNDWVWNLIRLLTTTGLISIILLMLNPAVLLVNFLMIMIFLAVALRISQGFSKYAKKQTKVFLNVGSTIDSLTLNLNSIRKNSLGDFFFGTYRNLIDLKWDALRDVRNYHARRWLIQLILFELIHTATLFYGIYLVIEGRLDLGIILLIQWAYSQLWSVVVYIIEYRVALLQQHENAKLARETFTKLLKIVENPKIYSNEWNKLEIRSAKVVFEKGDKGHVTISLPHFEIHKGQKVGLIGESGSGKSTLLYLLAGLMDFDGELVIDNILMDKDTIIDPSQYTLVDNISSFFNISLIDNLTLGKDIEQPEIERVINGLTIDTFEKDLEKKYGESAATYSAGQIQRLRIAQGILRDTPIYFFDEPFNGIDDRNKRKIMDFIHDFTKDKTMILVTHNQEELEMVDRIYEMKDRVLTERVTDQF